MGGLSYDNDLLLSSNGRTEAWPVSREEFEKTLAPSMTLEQPRDLSDRSNLQRRKIFSCKPDLSQQRQDTNDKGDCEAAAFPLGPGRSVIVAPEPG